MAENSFLMMIGCAFITSGCLSDERRAVRAFCKAYEDCQPENFAEEYEGVKQCVRESTETLDEAAEKNGGDCSAAFSTAIECAADANAESCDFGNVVDECRDEILEAFTQCPDFDLGSLDLGEL